MEAKAGWAGPSWAGEGRAQRQQPLQHLSRDAVAIPARAQKLLPALPGLTPTNTRAQILFVCSNPHRQIENAEELSLQLLI